MSQNANEAFAQRPQTIEVGAHGGVSYYLGDINPGKQFLDPQVQWGIVARYNYNPRWSYRIDYTHSTLISSDATAKFRPERGLGFSTIINDFSAIVEFNFFEYYTGVNHQMISPYLFGGFSVLIFEPYSYDGTTQLRPLMTEGQEKPYSNVSYSIPFGVGLKLGISEHLGLTFEWRMQKAFTDYIDDVGGLYPPKEDDAGYYFSDPTNTFSEGMQRGDSSNKDWYSFVGMSITWKFNLPMRQMCNAQ